MRWLVFSADMLMLAGGFCIGFVVGMVVFDILIVHQGPINAVLTGAAGFGAGCALWGGILHTVAKKRREKAGDGLC